MHLQNGFSYVKIFASIAKLHIVRSISVV